MAMPALSGPFSCIAVLAAAFFVSGCTSHDDPQKVGYVLKVCEFSANYAKQDARHFQSSTTIGSFCTNGLKTAVFLSMLQAAFEVPNHRNVLKELRPNAQRVSEYGNITMLELGTWLEKTAESDEAFEWVRRGGKSVPQSSH